VTDTGSVTSYAEFEPETPRGWSPLAVALIATLVLLLGLGGAIFGIYVANKPEAAGPPTTVPQAFPTSTPSPAADATPTASPPTDTFGLPNLAGVNFQDARRQVRELKLGWALVFEGDTGDMTVRTTTPAAGSRVRKGTAIKIYVNGPAPLATVPGIVGLTCAQAASIIVEQGLYPDYETVRSGVVLGQSPRSDEPQTLHWNDRVKIRCGPQISPSPAA